MKNILKTVWNFITNKETWYVAVALIALCTIIVLFILFQHSCRRDKKETIELSMYQHLQDSFTLVKNKNGSLTARIETLEGFNNKQFLDLQTQDETILRLQSLVRNKDKEITNLKAAAVVSTETNVEGKTTTVIEYVDRKGNPTYTGTIVKKGKFDNKPINWVIDSIYASCDTIKNYLIIQDKYDFTFGWDKPGLFKKAKPYADITSYNPYNAIQEFRSYAVKTKQYNWSFGIGVTYGIVLPTFEFHPVIGIGIQRTLWKF